jgi:hypothetical protein
MRRKILFFPLGISVKERESVTYLPGTLCYKRHRPLNKHAIFSGL